MPDLYLQALMRGEMPSSKSPPKKIEKDPLDLEIEKKIDAYVATLYTDENPTIQQFNSLQMKRARAKEEIKESFQLRELTEFLEKGFTLLVQEGPNYLEQNAYQTMLEDFNSIQTLKADLKTLTDSQKSLSEFLKFSASTLASIYTVALEKFKQDDFEGSLALFIILTTLVPNDEDYWLRAGIAAHSHQNFELALSFYAAAFSLNPELFSAKLFHVDCLLKLGQKDQAKSNLENMQNLIFDESWNELYSQLKGAL